MSIHYFKARKALDFTPHPFELAIDPFFSCIHNNKLEALLAL